jgi:Zn finger protein HypA/HybF involved in hydrogenase expression
MPNFYEQDNARKKADFERAVGFPLANTPKPNPKTNRTALKCMECGHAFSRVIGPRTVEVECPKCHGVDVEPD